MKVGVPTEIKTDEYRVALTPSGVRELVEHGHEVVVQAGAGEGSAIADADYEAQGAAILPDADAVFGAADMIVKVKEPQPVEVARLEPRHTLFTYLHLAPDPELTQGLIDSGATCIAYETVEDARGRLPLLAPMSEVAGKIATQAGAFMLEKPLGGRGMLLGGVPGVAAGKVMVIGGGVVGMNAAVHRGRHGGRGLRLRPQHRPPARARPVLRRPRLHVLRLDARDRAAAAGDGPRDRRGARPRREGAARDPRDQLGLMKRNAVLVDVSIDQGGCFETSRPTTHSDPTYEVDGITHYCVANMPGAVPVTSTYALTNATMPVRAARSPTRASSSAARENPGLARGRQRRRGQGHLRAGGRGDRAWSTRRSSTRSRRPRPPDAAPAVERLGAPARLGRRVERPADASPIRARVRPCAATAAIALEPTIASDGRRRRTARGARGATCRAKLGPEA